MKVQDARIRRAKKADLPAVIALLADDPLGRDREEASHPLPAGYHEAFDEIEDDPGQFLLVAETGGHIVGTLQLSILPNLTYGGRRRAQVEGVRIAKQARGLGIGRALVEEAKAIAIASGCHMLQLTTNRQRPEAVHFYERLGFVDSHHGLKLYLQD
jgi:ribosomal protein S18 acetylase RimI-like enzyme